MREAELDRWVMERRPIFCKKCGGKLFYQSGGAYECELCQSEELDDFGKVKRYLDEHGPTPAATVSDETGVPVDILNVFLRNGRLEIPEGSKYYIKCEKCGCALRFGRYCQDCTKQMAGQLKGSYFEQMGEKPQRAVENAQMRFLDKKSSAVKGGKRK